jgi:hypothetical protein
VAPTLTVFASGPGTVTSSPRGLACPGTCSASFAQGQAVTLTAEPQAGARFAGWAGACSGAGACTVSLAGDALVSASFEAAGGAADETLTVSLAGGGTVTSSPAGIACPGSCTARFPAGTTVQLSAVPGESASFSGWGGRCSGTGSCSVTLSAPETVSASFAEEGAAASAATPAAARPLPRLVPSQPIALGGRIWRGVAGDELRGFIATFAASKGPYGARIDWGDGRRSGGEVAQVFSGSWSIYGTHAYARPGTYGVRVTVTARAGRIRTIRAGVEVRAPGEPLRLG